LDPARIDHDPFLLPLRRLYVQQHSGAQYQKKYQTVIHRYLKCRNTIILRYLVMATALWRGVSLVVSDTLIILRAETSNNRNTVYRGSLWYIIPLIMTSRYFVDSDLLYLTTTLVRSVVPQRAIGDKTYN